MVSTFGHALVGGTGMAKGGINNGAKRNNAPGFVDKQSIAIVEMQFLMLLVVC